LFPRRCLLNAAPAVANASRRSACREYRLIDLTFVKALGGIAAAPRERQASPGQWWSTKKAAAATLDQKGQGATRGRDRRDGSAIIMQSMVSCWPRVRRRSPAKLPAKMRRCGTHRPRRASSQFAWQQSEPVRRSGQVSEADRDEQNWGHGFASFRYGGRCREQVSRTGGCGDVSRVGVTRDGFSASSKRASAVSFRPKQEVAEEGCFCRIAFSAGWTLLCLACKRSVSRATLGPSRCPAVRRSSNNWCKGRGSI